MTLTVAQALRPYPQFGSLVEDWAPLGNTWYDALQAKLTKRTSHGLGVTGAFTWSKTLDVDAENYNGGGVINDQFNRQNLKALSSSDLPNVFVVSFNYVIPKLGPNRYVRAVVGDWTLSGTMQYHNGALIATPAAQNNLSTNPVPQHLVQPRAWRAAVPDGHQRPRRSQQAVLVQPGSLVRSGRWAVGLTQPPTTAISAAGACLEKMRAWAGFSTSGKR